MSNYKSLKIMKIVKSFNIEHQGCFSGFSFLYRERLCGSVADVTFMNLNGSMQGISSSHSQFACLYKTPDGEV